MNQTSETSEKLSAREKTEMDAKEFHRGYNWRMVLGDPTEKPPINKVRSDRSPRAGILDVNDINLEPDDFAATQRLMDKSVPATASDSDSGSDEHTTPVQSSAVAKLFLFLLAALTVAIVVPWCFPLGHWGEQPLALFGDPGNFRAPAGSGNSLDERSLAPGFSSEPIDPALMSSKGSFEEMRPAAQNCLPVDPRSGFVPGNAAAERGPSGMPQGSSVISPALASRRLQEIELRLRECELIIQLLDSGKGAFSGFVPENNITGISSLARFQEKIVQLEINKQALAVRFAPTSKEIQAIELEIQGVKAAMRDCVEANLRFFQKGREQLLGPKGGSQSARKVPPR